MTVFAYLRVSTDAQDVANQRHGVDAYCRQREMQPVYVEDTASGRTEWRDRRLGSLIAEAKAGDVLVVSEISRLARSTLQVLEIARACAEQGIAVHIVKSGIVLDGSMQAKVTATVMGLAAEIERDLISSRTRESLAKRKAAGMRLGRVPGKPLRRVKLDDERRKIVRLLESETPLRVIAREVGCSPNTLYSWLNRRGLRDGGMGGMPPMVTEAAADQPDHSRAVSTNAKTSIAP